VIHVCENMSFVKDFMLLPEISKFAEHGANLEEVTFKYDNKEIWLTFSDENKVIGIINVHVETGTMCMFHPYILSAYRDQYFNMCMRFFDWCAVNLPADVLKLNAVIPVLFKATLKIAKKCGMKVEGIDRISYRSNRGVHDRILLGITREEINNG